MSVAIPARAAAAFRPSASPGLLAASAATAATFTATPFVIAEAASRFSAGIGAAALLSTAQMAGFTVANLVGNRRFRPSASLARRSVGLLVVTSAVSIITPELWVLVGVRALAGVAMGLLTWIAWADSATDGQRRGEIAAIGPLTAAVAAPVLGVAAGLGGLAAVFTVLTAASIFGLVLRTEVAEHDLPTSRNPIQAPGVRLVLTSLFVMTAAASSVFVFARVIAADLDLSSTTTSLALSSNAIAGIPAARFAGRRRLPGLWLAVIGACALLLTQTTSVVVYFAVVTVWGLAFWAAVPEVFSILADRSAFPSDRVGDAQAAMAFGRVVGPTAGAAVLSGGSLSQLGVAAFAAILCSGVAIEIVATDHRRSKTT